MNLTHAVRLDHPSSNHVICIAGAGGKTTALFQLARELTPPVIVTTTTHLGEWQIPLADKHVIAESPAPLEELEHGLHGIILVTGPIHENKTTPIAENLLKWLREYCGYHDLPLLIEADGSRQKPLKAPAEHEPAIPEFADHVIYVAGLSGLGKPLSDETVHRPEIFAQLSGLKIGDPVTPDALTNVLTHPQGGLKGIPPASKRTVILNQADTAESQAQAGSISPALLKAFDSVVVASLDRQSKIVNRKSEIHAVHERVAGIILAAGASTRYGQPKQLLDWRGQPFVRAVAQTALAAGLSPVVVVTGANAEQVESAVKDLDVKIVRNEDWQSGQSSSIKTGVKSLPKNTGASLFLLADQPQIGTDVIRALMEGHTRELHPIIAPLVLEERRANPILFDKAAFSDLMNLEGDIGGRAIFSKYKVEYMPWHDDKLLLDVDKPEDYQRLVEDDTL